MKHSKSVNMATSGPTILFSCVCYRQVILVTHQIEPENFTSIVSNLLTQVPNVPGYGEKKLTYAVERFQVHMLVDNTTEVMYLCITELTDRHLLPFTFLDTIKVKFSESNSLCRRAPYASENEFDRDFAPVLAAVVFNFNTGQGDKLLFLEMQLHDVKEIVLNNVEKLVERNERLDDLIEKTENLAASSTGFHQRTQNLLSQQKCKNLKMWLIISALLGIILTIAFLIALGIIRL